MNQNFTKFAFTNSVKEVQEQFGSRKSYARMETSGDRYVLTSKEISFIQSRDSFYMATVGDNGPCSQASSDAVTVLHPARYRSLPILPTFLIVFEKGSP